MLNSVIIVLRETMEASLLVGFLFIFSDKLSITKHWMLKALVLGGGLAILIASLLPDVSDLFDGVGQEALFSIVLLMLSLLIQWTIAILLLSPYWIKRVMLIQGLFIAIITLAISLEGAEIIIFFQSGLSNKNNFYPTLLGGVLGIGIGISIGAIGYYLISQTEQWRVYLSSFFLAFLSAGMVSQTITYLMQADFVSAGYPVWNSNGIINERSIFGQLLYAMIGYEATPTLSQVLAYSLYLIIPLSIGIYRFQKTKSREA